MAERPAGLANIGPRERRKRLAFGAGAVGGGVALSVLGFAESSGLGLLAVAALYFAGALGLLQARAHT